MSSRTEDKLVPYLGSLILGLKQMDLNLLSFSSSWTLTVMIKHVVMFIKDYNEEIQDICY